MLLIRSLMVAILIMSLTACMVGPNFEAPPSPQTDRYTQKPYPKKTVSTPQTGKGGKAQQFITGKNLPEDWWNLFHSKEINHLVTLGLLNNPTLAAAKQTLIVAQETLRAQIGLNYYPAVNAQFAAERQRVNLSAMGIDDTGGSSQTIFNLFNTSINVSYALDVFGGLRRQIEALRAQVDYQRYELAASYLTLTSNIVTTSITIASLEQQIKATKDLIEFDTEQLGIIKKQLKLGGVALSNVLSQEALLAQVTATLPALEKRLAIQKHTLAILIGQLPSEANLPKINFNTLVLPTQLPISIPSQLVQQRPDVQAATAQLHVASANIGVATANLFPQLNLTGAYGWSSTTFNDLLAENVKVWNLAGQLAQPVFKGGALRAQKRAAVATFMQVKSQYEQTVLLAFKNVADALRALEQDAKILRAQQAAETASYQAFILTKKQFNLGGVNFLNLLTAEEQYQQARIARIQATATRYTDTVALFQALGGGWWHEKP